MFQLTKVEAEALRSQIATSKTGRGGRRYAPYVFTEQGVAMLSGVLHSDRAIAVNIEIMRAFVELRRAAGSYALIEKRLEQIEEGMDEHDERFAQIFNALRQLINPPAKPKATCRLQGARGRRVATVHRRSFEIAKGSSAPAEAGY